MWVIRSTNFQTPAGEGAVGLDLGRVIPSNGDGRGDVVILFFLDDFSSMNSLQLTKRKWFICSSDIRLVQHIYSLEVKGWGEPESCVLPHLLSDESAVRDWTNPAQ